MNKIIITGRITQDLEIKTAGSGIELCNFSVAVDRRRKDKDGEKQSDFFNCTVFGKSASFLTTYFKKGDGINLEGRMESRKYTDKEGQNRTAWNLVVDNIEFPLGKGKASSESAFTELPAGNEADLPF